MTLSLNDIPDVDVAPSEAGPTMTLSALPVVASRRGLMRGMALGAATVGTLVATSSGRLAPKAAAETSPNGALSGWDRNDCKDAYPNGYREQTDNVGAYTTQYAACFGGQYIGSTLCANGWYRNDRTTSGWNVTTYRPTSDACGQYQVKNAWRWTTPDGKVWRCSDGYQTVSWGGMWGWSYFGVCRAAV